MKGVGEVLFRLLKTLLDFYRRIGLGQVTRNSKAKGTVIENMIEQWAEVVTNMGLHQ